MSSERAVRQSRTPLWAPIPAPARVYVVPLLLRQQLTRARAGRAATPPGLPVPFGPAADIAAARPGGSQPGWATWQQGHSGKSAWRNAATVSLPHGESASTAAATHRLLLVGHLTASLPSSHHRRPWRGDVCWVAPWRNAMCHLPAATESPAALLAQGPHRGEPGRSGSACRGGEVAAGVSQWVLLLPAVTPCRQAPGWRWGGEALPKCGSCGHGA